MIRTLPAGKTRLITPYRIGVSLVLAIAAAAMYVAFVSSKDPEPRRANPQAIVAFEPAEDTIALRQSRIFVKLQPGYVASLIIEGVEIPEAQLDHLEGSNSVGYTPGEGTVTGEFKPGEQCATVAYWRPEATRASAESHTWCWRVH